MRYWIALFMSLCLCLNAAHLIATGVHEAVEHGSNPLVTMVLELHDLQHADEGRNHVPDPDDLAQAHADHNHAHPPLLTLIPATTSAAPDENRHVQAVDAGDALVSVAQPRLERPPRSSRA